MRYNLEEVDKIVGEVLAFAKPRNKEEFVGILEKLKMEGIICNFKGPHEDGDELVAMVQPTFGMEPTFELRCKPVKGKVAKLTYFKPSGKFYSEEQVEVPGDMDALDYINQVKDLLEKRGLPGLIGNHSEFIVHVKMDDFVKIIMPKKWHKVLQALWCE